jgi:hypothetical protein
MVKLPSISVSLIRIKSNKFGQLLNVSFTLMLIWFAVNDEFILFAAQMNKHKTYAKLEN